jgi:hypothetical protein
MGLESFEKLCKSFDWERFLPWQISRGNHLAPIRITGAALPRSDVTTAYFGLRIGIQGRRVRRYFKLHALQWLFDDVRP